jgi:hypothetical protein
MWNDRQSDVTEDGGLPVRLSSRILVWWALLIVVSPGASLGQEHDAEGAEAEEAFHKNHLSLFTGGTTESRDGSTSTYFSLGLDYERRISELIGLGVSGEFVFGGEEREALAGLLFNLHPAGGLVLAAGPGLEFAKERHAEGEVEAQQEESGTETHFGFRVGVLYEFEVGQRYSIAPSIYTDFIEGKEPTFVWGLAFGVGF